MNPWNNGNSYDPEPPEPFSWLSKPCIWVYVLIAFLCILFVGIGLARAEPPPGAIPDSPLATWFQRLKEPHFPSACCGYHQDCWETEAKWEGDHWIALYHPDRAHPEISRWVNINPDVVNDDDHLPDHYNMAVKAVLCAAPWNMTDHDPTEFCFVPPAQTY